MDDLKLTGKTEEEFKKKSHKYFKNSVMISISNFDLTSVQRSYRRKQNYFTHKMY